MLNPKKNAYDNGYLAAMNGNSNTRNPFEKNTEDYNQWLDGWVDGRVEFDKQLKISKKPPEKPLTEYQN